MNAVIDKRQKDQIGLTKRELSLLKDNISEAYNMNHRINFSSKQLDREFNQNLSVLAKLLNRLNEKDRDVLSNTLSNMIESYIQTKIEKELDNSIYKILSTKIY